MFGIISANPILWFIVGFVIGAITCWVFIYFKSTNEIRISMFGDVMGTVFGVVIVLGVVVYALAMIVKTFFK